MILQIILQGMRIYKNIDLGHGFFEAYFHRFKLKETNGRCECGKREDVKHLRERCMIERWVNARNLFMERMEGRELKLRIGGKICILFVDYWNEFANSIIKDENI